MMAKTCQNDIIVGKRHLGCATSCRGIGHMNDLHFYDRQASSQRRNTCEKCEKEKNARIHLRSLWIKMGHDNM
jgi:hypothetical protein